MSRTRRGAWRGGAAAGMAKAGERPRLTTSATIASLAAELEMKYATGQNPTHPANIRAQEALNRIREATSRRVDINSSRRTSSGPTPTCWRRSAAVRSISSTCRR